MPGVLPVLNAEAVRMAVRFGTGIDAAVARRSVFARKNYFYPTSRKATRSASTRTDRRRGAVEIRLDDGSVKRVGVTRAHLERTPASRCTRTSTA